MHSISVVIPNYNGRQLLAQYLPPLIDSLKKYVSTFEVIVVDDASTDSSVSYIKENFPEIILLTNKKNCGFGETMNRGIFKAQYEVVFSLNSDVLVDSDIFSPVLTRFSDRSIFAITPNIIDPRSGQNQAPYRLKAGVCWYIDTCLQQISTREEIPLFFACAGACFYHREKLLLLGGFDSIFSPFYVEDVDLSYQAWKRGWKNLLEPSVTVYHISNSTINKHNKKHKIKFLTARNKNYFLWMNITDPLLVLRYLICLIPSLMWDIVTFRKYKFVGTFMAIPRLPEVLRKRHIRRQFSKVSDAEIIRKVSFKGYDEYQK